MTFGDIVAYAIRGLAAILAILVARRERAHRATAVFFVSVAVADLSSAFIVRAIGALPTPYTGSARVLFHVEQAFFVLWPAGMAALAWQTFLRRTPWLIGLGYLAVITILVIGYPVIRGITLGWVYAGTHLLAIILGAVCLGVWFRLGEKPNAEHSVATLLICLDIGASLGPYWEGNPFARWPWAQIVYGLLYVALILFYVRLIWIRTSHQLPSVSPSRSPRLLH